MKTFPRLRKAVELENARECVECKRSIRNDDIEKICRWLTPHIEKKFKAGTIDLKTAKNSAIKRIENDFEKRLKRKIEKIDRAENAREFFSIDISVEWKKSRTKGNPTATVRAWTSPHSIETGSGSAGGWGYDKESAAIADALNSCPSIMSALYEVAEQIGARKEEYREKIGYGSGYDVVPYFEGGVGVSCYYQIFESMGYTMRHTASGSTFDVYTVSKNEGTK